MTPLVVKKANEDPNRRKTIHIDALYNEPNDAAIYKNNYDPNNDFTPQSNKELNSFSESILPKRIVASP